MYFDQQTDAPPAVCWSKSSFYLWITDIVTGLETPTPLPPTPLKIIWKFFAKLFLPSKQPLTVNSLIYGTADNLGGRQSQKLNIYHLAPVSLYPQILNFPWLSFYFLKEQNYFFGKNYSKFFNFAAKFDSRGRKRFCQVWFYLLCRSQFFMGQLFFAKIGSEVFCAKLN